VTQRVLVAATVPPYKSDDSMSEWSSWLENAGALVEDAALNDCEVEFFAALETDGRGLKPHSPLLQLLSGLGGSAWTFSIDTGATSYGTGERLVRIVTGRNLITDYAMRNGHDWIFYVDSDLRPDPKTFTKLFALSWPVCGGDVPHYCLSGPAVTNRRHWGVVDGGIVASKGDDGDVYAFPVEEHWNTAGYLLVNRAIFEKVRWRYESTGDGLTDDPCWAEDVEVRFGIRTLVRKDCVGQHAPLVPVERRGHDLEIRK